MLVNTEAFYTVDDNDAASDVEIRFGEALGEKIYFDRSQQTFRLTDDVYVENSIDVAETISGSALRVADDVGIGIEPDAARFHIKGGGIGEKFRYETSQTPYSLRIGGGFSGTADEVAVVAGAGVESHNADTDSTAWSFNFSGLNDYLAISRGSNNGAGNVVTWTQHFRMDADGDVSIGLGAADAKTKLEVGGTISGSSLYAASGFGGAGLSDCDADSQVLGWDAVTQRFVCGDDDGGAGGGLAYPDAEGIFVNQGGDTMTGTLVIDKDGGTGTGLVVRERAFFGSGVTVSGSLMLDSRSDPRPPPPGFLKLYAKSVSGRQLLKGIGPSGVDYPYQPSFFQNQICMLSAGASTTINAVGCSATNDTTVSHPTPTETYGFMANFATAATALDNAGTSSNVASFFRGSTTGANGFFFNARIGVVDATDVRLFIGMANQTIATMTDSNNPSGHYAGFQFSTNRADAAWQFVTKNNVTQDVSDTGLAVSTSKVYDMYVYCTPQCATIYWRVDNVTDGTTAEGSTATNLPGGSTALRGMVGVGAVAASAKNIRMQRMYIESDR